MRTNRHEFSLADPVKGAHPLCIRSARRSWWYYARETTRRLVVDIWLPCLALKGISSIYLLLA